MAVLNKKSNWSAELFLQCLRLNSDTLHIPIRLALGLSVNSIQRQPGDNDWANMHVRMYLCRRGNQSLALSSKTRGVCVQLLRDNKIYRHNLLWWFSEAKRLE